MKKMIWIGFLLGILPAYGFTEETTSSQSGKANDVSLSDIVNIKRFSIASAFKDSELTAGALKRIKFKAGLVIVTWEFIKERLELAKKLQRIGG